MLSAGVLPFSHVFGIGDEIATTKSILHAIGVFDSDEVRAPLVPATPERRELLVLAYELAARAAVPDVGRSPAPATLRRGSPR